jgi:hypothetical protein
MSHVDYLKPTSPSIELEVPNNVMKEWIPADGRFTVRGEVIMVQIPSRCCGVVERETRVNQLHNLGTMGEYHGTH